MIRIGVTGTDTGVGKTVVACAITRGLRRELPGELSRVAAMKPVESGGTEDAERLWRASGMLYPMELVCPVTLVDPLAPMEAARRAGTDVDIATLDNAFNALRAASDAIVVEGAGGLLVPITAAESFATLFGRWELDLVIVAANRLGAINHTLLTVEAARRRGMRVRAIILNTISAAPPGDAELSNARVIGELVPDIPVVPFDFVHQLDGSTYIPLKDIGLDNDI
jgi:dethiobiotin synthetase